MNNFEEEHFMPEMVDEQIEHYLSQQVDPNRTPERQTVQELQQHYAPPIHDDQQEQALSRVWRHLVQQDASLPALSSARSEEHTLPLPVIRANQQERRTAPSAPLLHVHRRPKRAFLGRALVAVLIILLVGSFLAVFQQLRQLPGRSTASATPKVPGRPTATATISPTSLEQASIYAMVNHTLYRLNPVTHTPLWQFQMPVPTDVENISEWRQVVQGVYYTLGPGSDGYYLYAINTADGSLRWKLKVPYAEADQGVAGYGPLIANGVLYLSIASMAHGYSDVSALDISNGNVLWQQRYEGTGIMIRDDPASDMTAGLVLQAATSEILYGTTYTGTVNSAQVTIFALKAKTGQELWRKSRPSAATPEYGYSQVVDGVLCMTEAFTDGSQPHYVYGYDAATGSLEWSVPLDGSIQTLATLNGILYLGVDHLQSPAGGGYYIASGSVYALRASDGGEIWHYNTAAGASIPVVANGTVYVSLSHEDSSHLGDQAIIALNASTGDLRWSQPAPDDSTGQPEPAVSKQFVYASMNAHQVAILRVADGKLVATFTVGEAAAGSSNRIVLTIVE